MSAAKASRPRLDLTSWVNPQAWPVPPLPVATWHLAASAGDGLEAAAADYYGNPNLLALPGRPAAINLLPQLFPPAMVACLDPLASEHPDAWQRGGHRVRLLQNASLTRAVGAATPVVVLANPNPLNATLYSPDALLDAARQLGRRGAWLVVDESLVDPLPELSVATQAGTADTPKLVVLRSVPEFFGLVGAPVAFVLAHPDLLARLGTAKGVPDIAHPVRAVARMALADTPWHGVARTRLANAGARLRNLLTGYGEVGGSPLATLLTTADADRLHAHLDHHGIATGLQPPATLRFGLPGQEEDWQCLANALATWKA